MELRFRFPRLRFMLPLLLLTPTAWAQTSEANLSGTVSDTTGAVIPNAAVKLTSKDQGTVRSVQTNNAGVYQYSFLPPGPYMLEITSQGFKTLTQDNLVLAAAQNARMDFKLEVGNVSENVRSLRSPKQLTPNRRNWAQLSITRALSKCL